MRVRPSRVACLAAVAALLVWALVGGRASERGGVPVASLPARRGSEAGSVRSGADVPSGAHVSAGGGAVSPPIEPPRAVDPHASRPDTVWRRQVAAVLRRGALRRLGRALAPAAETRLVDAIATIGPAARGLDRDTLDPDDPASIAAVRERTAALLAADRVCREELGVGVMALLRTLDHRAIEDGAAEDHSG